MLFYITSEMTKARLGKHLKKKLKDISQLDLDISRPDLPESSQRAVFRG